jgi:NAD(P)-dependent dehydrogenase (short-subunit alcohol dehydrogenase family)
MSRVLVTGASGAAGGGVVEAFLAAGWQVAGATRGTPPADAADGVTWVSMDLADEASARAGTAQAVERLGGLDAVVCLAGGFRLTPVDEASWEDFAGLIDLDYRPTVVTVLAALPHLGEGGSIVTIGAKAAQAPGPRSSAYVAAKAGVIAFSASLAAELRPRGIRVNCVTPGTIDTPANRESMPNAKTANWVTPRQLGELLRYLASPESSPLTGAAIPIG